MPVRLILAGGGLANCLIARRLTLSRPDVQWTILEAGPRLGGNHTWSFHAEDLTPEQAAWVDPFVTASWPAYRVAFPRFERRVPLGYRSISSERLDRVMRETKGGTIRTDAPVAALSPSAVTLVGGETLEADAVVDGRGYRPSRHLTIAYQKFLGLEVRTAGAHGVDLPIIMDATVPQRDGFRFVYVLPLTPDRLLVEDTYYSDHPLLDVAATRGLIERYIRNRGWKVAAVLREEQGILPIALGGDIGAFWAEAEGVPRSGLRAALFHPTTGYSLPDAVRLADRIAMLDDFGAQALHAATRDQSVRSWKRAGFYRLLDRLLFRAAEPDGRYKLLERFYTFSPALVARFYAGRSTLADKVRVLSGRPPVPVGRALRCLSEGSVRPAAVRS